MATPIPRTLLWAVVICGLSWNTGSTTRADDPAPAEPPHPAAAAGPALQQILQSPPRQVRYMIPVEELRPESNQRPPAVAPQLAAPADPAAPPTPVPAVAPTGLPRGEVVADAAPPVIQMAILLDTSGSMRGLVNQARAHLWKIVNEFAAVRNDGKAPRLEVALYQYGSSRLPAEEGYLKRVVPLTDDLDRVSEALFALTISGSREYCGQTIQAAVEELDWTTSEKHLRCIFIAGNESFAQGPVAWGQACRGAITKGITVSTIFCGPEQTGVQLNWKTGAELAMGSYLSIDQNRAVAEIAAPQDKKLVELSAKLNETYVAFGKKQQREKFLQNQVQQDTNAAAVAPSAAADRAAVKASGVYQNFSRDLVDACREGTIKLEDLKPEELPENLQKMTLKEQKAYIEVNAARRSQIQQQIQELSTARNSYIAKERTRQAKAPGEKGNSLDDAIIQSVREQVARKSYQITQPRPNPAPQPEK